MEQIDIPAKKMAYLASNDNQYSVILDGVKFGKENSLVFFLSYLLFDLEEIPENIVLVDANIVLYNDNVCSYDSYHYCHNRIYQYKITPLSEYVNYMLLSSIKPIRFEDYGIIVETDVGASIMEFDITEIVDLWIRDQIYNYGVCIEGVKHAPVINCSPMFAFPTFVMPTLRIRFVRKQPYITPAELPKVKLDSWLVEDSYSNIKIIN